MNWDYFAAGAAGGFALVWFWPRRKPLVPDGWQLVPVTPTAAMLAAPIGGDRHNPPRLESRADLRPAIWAAMLKAAK